MRQHFTGNSRLSELLGGSLNQTMNTVPTATPNSPAAANAGSPNGALSQPVTGPVTLDVLSAALAAVDSPGQPENQESPPAGFAPAPEATPNPADAASPVETAPEQTPLAGSEPETAGDVLSQTEEAGGEDPLAGLEADVRERAIELARELKAGGLTVGEVKRIGKLLHQKGETESQFRQQIEGLQQEIEQLKSSATPAEDAAAVPMPAKVAALKNPREIEQREFKVQSVLDWCEDNPDGGELNGQTFSADEVKAIRRDARQELRWLPRRQQQLEQQAQLRQQQQAVRSQTLKDFPVLNDPENPDTQLARRLMSTDPQLAQRPNADYLALALAMGHRLLQADLQKRKAPAAAKPAAAANGLPRAKPAANGGASAAPRATPQGNVNQLLKSAKERPSPAALEALLPHVR